MMGLVTPAMLGHLDNWDQAFYYAVTRHWPDYVVALQGMAWAEAGREIGLPTFIPSWRPSVIQPTAARR